MKCRKLENSFSFNNLFQHYDSAKNMFTYVGPIIQTLEPVVKDIVEKKLIYFNIHIWSYKFGKRIGEFHLPSTIESDPVFRTLDAVFLTRTKRASYNKLFFCLPPKKRPFVLLRKQPGKRNKPKIPYIVLPEKVFLLPDLRKLSSLPLDNLDRLKGLMNETLNFARNNVNTPEGNEFWNYFLSTINKGLGYDISLYENKESIFEMFAAILIRKEWIALYFIPADILKRSEVGVSGFYIYVSELLPQDKVEKLQKLARFCFGKLAQEEFILLLKEVKDGRRSCPKIKSY